MEQNSFDLVKVTLKPEKNTFVTKFIKLEFHEQLGRAIFREMQITDPKQTNEKLFSLMQAFATYIIKLNRHNEDKTDYFVIVTDLELKKDETVSFKLKYDLMNPNSERAAEGLNTGWADVGIIDYGDEFSGIAKLIEAIEKNLYAYHMEKEAFTDDQETFAIDENGNLTGGIISDN